MAEDQDPQDQGGDADAKALREAFTDDDARWDDIREARQQDIKALGPDSTWTAEDRDARKEAGRPCLSFDELGQYVNQLVNDARETNRAIEVNPAGDASTAGVARLVGDLIRQIERKSNAQLAYTAMFENAVSGSYGFLRVLPRYVQAKVGEKPTARAFDQELVIEAIPNPDVVVPGYFMKPDFSDCRRMWVHESFTEREFKDRFGKTAKATSLDIISKAVDSKWADAKRLWVRECWEVRSKARRLLLIDQGGGEPLVVWADQLEGGAPENVRERVVEQPVIYQCLTNGYEILEERHDWPGRYLPIIGCIGKVLWTNEDRQILSLIRNALGPQQLFNYYCTTEAEIVGMTPKVPWFYYRGALDATNEPALKQSNQVPVGGIAVDPSPDGWPAAFGPVPFPQRTAFDPPIQAFEMGAESTRRRIQSATGTGFLPTDAQRVNQKSGVALKEITTSAAKGAFHFIDNFEHALRRTGEVLVDLIPAYYDRPRDLHVLGKDQKPLQVRVNDPQAPPQSGYGDAPLLLVPGMELDVALSTGPSYDNERDKASEFADQLVQARPEVFGAIGGDVVRLKNLGPEGDKLAEVLDAMAPPVVQALKAKGKAPSPREQQLEAQLKQLQQQFQQLQQIMAADQHKEQAKAAAAGQLEQMRAQTQAQMEQLKADVALALEELRGQQKLEQMRAQAEIDAADREDQQAHELAMAGAEAGHAETRAQQAALEASKARMFGGGGATA